MSYTKRFKCEDWNIIDTHHYINWNESFESYFGKDKDRMKELCKILNELNDENVKLKAQLNGYLIR